MAGYSGDPDNWIQQLQIYIKNIILEILPPVKNEPEITSQIRNVLISQKFMNVWAYSLTHVSWNPNVGKNYETLEHFGDRAMALAFDEYITRNNNISDAEANDLATYYLSKTYLPELTRKIGLQNYVRTRVGVDINVEEDIIESFFGALARNGESIQSGFGYSLCYSFLKYLFKDIKIDLNKGKSEATQLKEIYEKMGWGTVEYTPGIREYRSYETIILLPPVAINFFNSMKIFNVSNELARAIETSEKASKKQVEDRKSVV